MLPGRACTRSHALPSVAVQQQGWSNDSVHAGTGLHACAGAHTVEGNARRGCGRQWAQSPSPARPAAAPPCPCPGRSGNRPAAAVVQQQGCVLWRSSRPCPWAAGACPSRWKRLHALYSRHMLHQCVHGMGQMARPTHHAREVQMAGTWGATLRAGAGHVSQVPRGRHGPFAGVARPGCLLLLAVREKAGSIYVPVGYISVDMLMACMISRMAATASYLAFSGAGISIASAACNDSAPDAAPASSSAPAAPAEPMLPHNPAGKSPMYNTCRDTCMQGVWTCWLR